MGTHGDKCSEACYGFGMLISRRGLITGLASLVAAPAIVRAGSLMPVKAWADAIDFVGIHSIDPRYRAEFIAGFEQHYSLLNLHLVRETALLPSGDIVFEVARPTAQRS
jgi:hypothetical protein